MISKMNKHNNLVSIMEFFAIIFISLFSFVAISFFVDGFDSLQKNEAAINAR